MRPRKIALIILFTAILVGASVQPAQAIVPTGCQKVNISTPVDIDIPNMIKISSPWVVAPFINIDSFDGWLITSITLDVINDSDVAEVRNYSYSGGVTTFSDSPVSGAKSITKATVKLEKDCGVAEVARCKPTGDYVYTLLGNYPCNLISADKPIPQRFLDPDYTGPLCNLPDQDFAWNGKYLVNKVKDCGVYLQGGNYFDTSLP